MSIKRSEPPVTLWANCEELVGGMAVNIHDALVTLAIGVSVRCITTPGAKATEVTIPNLAERSVFAPILSDSEAEIIALEAESPKARLVKQRVMQELLLVRVCLG